MAKPLVASTAKAIKFTNNAFAVVAFIATVAIIWTLFGIGKYSNHLQRNAAIFNAVAETVVAAIMNSGHHERSAAAQPASGRREPMSFVRPCQPGGCKLTQRQQ